MSAPGSASGTPAPASPPDRIDYARLVDAFERGIEHVLRGFRADGAPEWLDLWVHDEDDVRSILNVFEAAHAAGLPSATVWVADSLLPRIEEERLSAVLSPLGRLEIGRDAGGLSLALRFGRGADSAAPLEQRESPVARVSRASAETPSLPRESDLAPYRDGIARALRSARHEGGLSPRGSGTTLAVARDGVTLEARVDADRRVLEAVHRGAANDLQRAIMEVLCDVMEGRPLDDCAHHATQYAHSRLRSGGPAVPGVAMPHNSHPAFALPERLARDLLAAHRERSGWTDDPINFHHAGPAGGWRALSESERSARVQDLLDRVHDQIGLPAGRCLSADAEGSVALAFSGPIPSADGFRLLELERRLKASLDDALYLHLEEMKDQNRLRVLDDRRSSR